MEAGKNSTRSKRVRQQVFISLLPDTELLARTFKNIF